MIGVRKDGVITGSFAREDLASGRELNSCHSIVSATVISDSVALDEVIQDLKAHPFLVVGVIGQIGGVICRRDLQKPAMRMCLFGLVTISELRFVQMIDEISPQDTWMEYVSKGRLQKARELRDERRRGQSPQLLDCLQFSDKGLIVAGQEKLRKLTRLTS